MTIETKFSPGDEVWVSDNNEPVELEVESISIFANEDGAVVTYRVPGYLKKALGTDLFPTKQALLESL